MSVYESYELYENIGHGASCTVKRAVRKDSRQVFAAKLYQSEFLTAKNEIDMLVRLDHPNIVNIYEVFEEDDCIILILEYMAGGELYDSVGQKTHFTENQVKEYMRIIVDAVRYCHEMNVVHRDIKPENLLLTSNNPEGLLKLADFGISKIMSDEMLTTNCGTPVYMAPQIWAGQAYDNKVDVWSVGVVMYYLLSGEHPFSGDSDTIAERIMLNELSFQNKIWNQISSKAIDLIRKMLEKDPQKRASAQQATGHIWFSQIDAVYNTIYEENEINLTPSVRKIRRFNFKRKEKRVKNKLIAYSQAEKVLSDVRLEFLIHESTEESNQTDFTDLKKSCNMEIEEEELQ